MLKDTISRTAFAAVLLAMAPAFADDTSTNQTLNSLNQQVQDQQKEIDALRAQQKAVRRKAAQQAQAAQPDYSDAADAADVVDQKPGVVAPLQPTSLGTLSVSGSVPRKDLGAVSQAAPPLPQPPPVYPPQPNIGLYPQRTPQLAPVTTVQQQAPVTAVEPLPAPQAVAQAPVQAPAATVTTNNQPGHVGQAPAMPDKPPEVQALASVGGVLTPYGKVVIEPFLQYSRSSVNTFVVDGSEIASALIIGDIQANRTARDYVSTGAAVRVGVSDRTELEARVPFVWRQDSITNTVPDQNQITTTNTSQGYGLGDVELAGHYQINDGHEDWPFFIGNLRFKSDTGTNPYDTSMYNYDGTARKLATGTGFMAVEPSVTIIYPSDPATLFANVGYIHSIDKTMNSEIANNFIGDVAPGDTYSAALGMGVALNDRLSFTLGYEHDYVRPTQTTINGVTTSSQSLQVGSALSGISYRVNNRTSVVLNLATGVTRDAPDEVVGLRVPITLQAF